MAFVEDTAAKEFCRAILEHLEPGLARTVSVEVRGGEGEVGTALRLTRTFESPFKFVGVYDADMKDRIPDDLRDIATCLPGDEPVEILFRKTVSADVGALSAATGRENLGPILAALEGADHHDWYEELAKELGLSKGQLFTMLFSLWIRDPENLKNATETMDRISSLIKDN